jgi:hypothetical protein
VALLCNAYWIDNDCSEACSLPKIKDAGFMMAEGPEILDYNTLLSVKNERNARWNAKQGGLGMAGYALPDVILKVTVNFYSKGVDKTLVKMKINSVV